MSFVAMQFCLLIHAIMKSPCNSSRPSSCCQDDKARPGIVFKAPCKRAPKETFPIHARNAHHVQLNECN